MSDFQCEFPFPYNREGAILTIDIEGSIRIEPN